MLALCDTSAELAKLERADDNSNSLRASHTRVYPSPAMSADVTGTMKSLAMYLAHDTAYPREMREEEKAERIGK
jgi:hypothetical protein